MHHELVDYVFQHADEWDGSDEFGLSFAHFDVDAYVYDVSDSAPEQLRNATQQHVARVLGEQFGARHLVLHWDDHGGRRVHAMPSYERAREAIDNLSQHYQDFLALSADLV